jgi:hypothetical protein
MQLTAEIFLAVCLAASAIWFLIVFYLNHVKPTPTQRDCGTCYFQNWPIDAKPCCDCDGTSKWMERKE